MSDDATTDYTHYLDDLTRALRSRGVPNDRIADIVGEVEFHVVSTGEAPFDTYGLPEQYADEVASTEAVASKRPKKPSGSSDGGLGDTDLVGPAVGVVGGACLAGGALSLGAGESWFGGVPAFLGLVLGLGLATYALVRALPDSFRDPETRETSLGEHSRPALVPAVFLAVLTIGLILVGMIVG